VDSIARAIDAGLESLGGTSEPRPQAEDAILLRRLYLDLAGRPPKVEELIADLADPSADPFAIVADRLVDSEAFAKNMARYWRATMLARPTEPRANLAAGSLEAYLTAALREGQGWDRIARDMITAEGSVREDGRTALIFAQSGKPEETVAEISRIFLGIQIQCAQCHNHPTDPWTREQFHELAAFFPRVAARPARGDGPRDFLVSVTDVDLPRPRRNDNRFFGTAEHYMPDIDQPDDTGTLMTPTFFINQQSLPLGVVDAVRREALADWITEPSNPWFARALVNRMWAEWVGSGMYRAAVDDLGPSRQCASPNELELLATGFVNSGHDLRWLARAITRTRAYRSQSRPPEDGDAATACTGSTARRLRSDQLFDQLAQVVGLSDDGLRGQRGAVPRVGMNPRQQFGAVFGFDPSLPFQEVSGSMTQTLALMNGALVQQAVRSPRGPIAQIVSEQQQDGAAIERLYLHVLSRFPSDRERTQALRYVSGQSDRAAAYEDLAWALINSAEFVQRR
jgi:hypothetical protein